MVMVNVEHGPIKYGLFILLLLSLESSQVHLQNFQLQFHNVKMTDSLY